MEPSIGKAVFKGCSSLTSVELPEGIVSIPEDAFRGCSSLNSFEIPATVTGIGQAAFLDSGIRHAVIPEGVEQIGDSAYKNCQSLSLVTLPANLSEISPQCFMGCMSLKTITIPANVSFIGAQAFADVDFDSVTSLNESAAPWMEEDVFSANTYNGATLFVPTQARSLYEEAQGWSRFMNIGVVTGIGSTVLDEPVESVEYFNLQGIKVIHPSSGIYIRKSGSRTEKVVIR